MANVICRVSCTRAVCRTDGHPSVGSNAHLARLGRSYARPMSDDRSPDGWVPSPGPWVPPPGSRPGWAWTPPLYGCTAHRLERR